MREVPNRHEARDAATAAAAREAFLDRLVYERQVAATKAAADAAAASVAATTATVTATMVASGMAGAAGAPLVTSFTAGSALLGSCRSACAREH